MTNSSIGDADVNRLLDAPGIPIPEQEGLRDKMFNYIKVNWKNRRNKSKDVNTIIKELKSACAKYNLRTTLGEGVGSILRSLTLLKEEKEEAIQRLKDDELEQDPEKKLKNFDIKSINVTIEDYDNHVNGVIASIALIFIDGPFIKENFIFDDTGMPIQIRPGEEGRWGQECVEEMRENKKISDKKREIALKKKPTSQVASMTEGEWYKAPPPGLVPESPPLSEEALAKVKETEAKVRAQTRAGRKRKNKRKTLRKRHSRR